VGFRVNKAEGEEEGEEEEEAGGGGEVECAPEATRTRSTNRQTHQENPTTKRDRRESSKWPREKHEQQRKCAFNTEFRLGARQFALLDALGAFGHERGC